MLSVLASRLGQAVLVMLAMSLSRFSCSAMSATLSRSCRARVQLEEKQELRRSLGLDRPILVQYGRFLGRRYRRSRHELPEPAPGDGAASRSGFPRPWNLCIVATFLSLAVGIPAEFFAPSAEWRGWRASSRRSSLIGISTPTFVTGIVLILVFAVGLRLLPSFGRGDVVGSRLVDHRLPDVYAAQVV